MATTIVITFCTIIRIHVDKMDAECNKKQRDLVSRREKRWSMNSQRLEEIVAALKKPISDARLNFDTDLSALLEEYLTEAGLHALDESENSPLPFSSTPNFAEVALLLQQSATIYGRKVDFLYQHVLDVSDSLQNSTLDVSKQDCDEPSAPVTSKRKCKLSVNCEFSSIDLEPASGAKRKRAPPHPPPTLPRLYLEIEPRLLADSDAPLIDFGGEPIGLLHDYYVSWRLQDGYLVDELECSSASVSSSLRTISLVELQAAIEAAAPPSPPPLRRFPSAVPLSPDTFAPQFSRSPHSSEMPPPTIEDALIIKKKRKSEVPMNDIAIRSVKMLITKKLRAALRRTCEFSVPKEWVERVVRERTRCLLAHRRSCQSEKYTDFRGFDAIPSNTAGGFPGWSKCDAAASRKSAELATTRLSLAITSLNVGTFAGTITSLVACDSDDDGFFEQCSLGDSDGSRIDDSSINIPQLTALESSMTWGVGVAERAALAEQRSLDVRTLAACVLTRLPPPTTPAPPATFSSILRDEVKEPHDISRLLLATLFLANAGNVEIIPGPPLSVNTFSIRTLSTDPRLYCAAAAADESLAR